MPQYLDVEDFPFTEDELREALMLQLTAEQAAEFAAQVVVFITESVNSHQAAAEARKRGSTDPAEVNPSSWATTPDLYALMWCLPQCASRTDELMERMMRKQEDDRIQLIMAMRRERIVGSAPPDVIREARRQMAPKRAGWTRRKRAMADRLGVPRPDGTVKS